jgi:hypothetical protein
MNILRFLIAAIEGILMGTLVGLVFIAIAMYLTSSAGAEEVLCKADIWGQTSCYDSDSGTRTTIKPNIWQELEVRKAGKLVARCKENIWQEISCNAVDN